jgi:hypothetical protein
MGEMVPSAYRLLIIGYRDCAIELLIGLLSYRLISIWCTGDWMNRASSRNPIEAENGRKRSPARLLLERRPCPAQ